MHASVSPKPQTLKGACVHVYAAKSVSGLWVSGLALRFGFSIKVRGLCMQREREALHDRREAVAAQIRSKHVHLRAWKYSVARAHKRAHGIRQAERFNTKRLLHHSAGLSSPEAHTTLDPKPETHHPTPYNIRPTPYAPQLETRNL